MGSGRIIAVVFLLLVLAGTALATDPFYHDWVYPGDTFTVRGQLYALESGTSPYSYLLTRGGERYVLNYDDCAVSQDGLERYCYTASDYVDCQRGAYDCPVKQDTPDDWCCPYDVSHIRFDAGGARYAAYLEFSDVTPEIAVTRSPATSVLKLGEDTQVTVSFENDGQDAITGAVYTVHVPDGFKVAFSKDFTRTADGLRLTFNIDPNGKRTYSYTVEPTDYVSGSFTANLHYTYLSEDRNITPSAFTLNVPSPFGITHALSKSSTPVGNSVTYTYTLKNTDGQQEMDAALNFTGFSDIATKVPDSVTEGAGGYAWSGTLAPGDQESFAFTLLPRTTGSYPAVAQAAMALGDETFTHRTQDTLLATVTQLKPEIRLSRDPLRGGQAYTLRLVLGNKDGETPFTDLRARLVAGSLARSFSLASIGAGDAPLLAELNLSAPEANTSIRLTFTLEGSYKTLYGELFPFSVSKVATVEPGTADYVITQEFNASEAAPGDEIELTVTVKNAQDTYRTVSVTDSLPGGALVTAGSRQQEMSLKSGESRVAYSYRVAIPADYASPDFTVTTQVFDKQTGEQYVKSADLAIRVPERPENATAPSAPATNTTEQPAKKKPGFFRRIGDAIVSFFKGIFS